METYLRCLYVQESPENHGLHTTHRQIIPSQSGLRPISEGWVAAGYFKCRALIGIFLKLVKVLRTRKVDVVCIQETKWKGK